MNWYSAGRMVYPRRIRRFYAARIYAPFEMVKFISDLRQNYYIRQSSQDNFTDVIKTIDKKYSHQAMLDFVSEISASFSEPQYNTRYIKLYKRVGKASRGWDFIGYLGRV